MAKLVPDSVYIAGGLCVKVKKIPFGTKWKKSYGSFKKGDLYKADRLMSGGTGKILGITVHNTGNGADAETYTRAVFNQNMGTARVHFYVDDKEAWQNLEINEVGWHAGTGDRGIGNDSYIAVEIIMGPEDSEKDRRAKENGAMLIAYLLEITGLSESDIVTHKHWSGKNCPAYLLPKWDEFLSLVKQKHSELRLEKLSDGEIADNIPSEYAKEAVDIAIKKGILRGNEHGDLMLKSAVTRQDLCVILSRAGVI